MDSGAGVTGGDGVGEGVRDQVVRRSLAIALPTADGAGWRFRGLTHWTCDRLVVGARCAPLGWSSAVGGSSGLMTGGYGVGVRDVCASSMAWLSMRSMSAAW